mmetsp:Transcript_6077/g.11193  ORF Transcript_6077/g.11193 Transcript_6077/m.11193 type:complete len:207 (-) Transcript_6077:491-1111(-)
MLLSLFYIFKVNCSNALCCSNLAVGCKLLLLDFPNLLEVWDVLKIISSSIIIGVGITTLIILYDLDHAVGGDRLLLLLLRVLFLARFYLALNLLFSIFCKVVALDVLFVKLLMALEVCLTLFALQPASLLPLRFLSPPCPSLRKLPIFVENWPVVEICQLWKPRNHPLAVVSHPFYERVSLQIQDFKIGHFAKHVKRIFVFKLVLG